MRLTFHGAAGTVTGSCHLLECQGQKILLDCGLFQGGKAEEALNTPIFPFDPREIDFLVVSHAHLDHVGRIPLLVRGGFKGKIYTHRATVDLAGIVMLDSAHIQEMEAQWASKKLERAGKKGVEPLYRQGDALAAMDLFHGIDYGVRVELGKGIALTLHDAGHILGSATVEVATPDGTLVYSGDLGQKHNPIIRNPEGIRGADWLILESTYGDRLHPGPENKEETMIQAVNLTVKRGGKLIIPAFAVERTQEVLYEISLLRASGKIPSLPVYVDSPMAIRATEVFSKHRETYDAEFSAFLAAGNKPFAFPGLHFLASAQESMSLNEKEGSCVIISASGMCDAGRIKHHLKHNLWRKENVILFVGYQAKGTLGRSILDGAKAVKIFGDKVAVKATILRGEGYSSHADQTGLLDWVDRFIRVPKRFFLVHGEDEAVEGLKSKLEGKGLAVTVAEKGKTEELIRQ